MIRINPTAIHLKSHSRLQKVSPTRWERLLPDGSKEVYDALVSPDPQGEGVFWLAQVVDPAGNAATLQYDANYRLSTSTDALGQVTTFYYAGPRRHLQGLARIGPLRAPGALQLQWQRAAGERLPTRSACNRTLATRPETSLPR